MENPYAFNSKAIDESGQLLLSHESGEDSIQLAQANRDTHLSTEESILIIGGLHILGAGLLVVLSLILILKADGYRLISQILGLYASPSDNWRYAVSGLMLVGSGLNGLVGIQLVKFNSISRHFSSVLCVLWCIALIFSEPVILFLVCLCNGYIIYLLQSKKGRYVCSDEYQVIMDTTTQRAGAKTPPYAFMMLFLFVCGLIMFLIRMFN